MAAADDIHDEIILHAIDLDRVRVQNRNKVLVFLKDLQADLIRELVRINPTANKSARIQTNRLRALVKQTDLTISSAYKNISRETDADLRQIAKLETDFGAHALNAGIGADIASSVTLSAEQLDILVTNAMIEGAPTASWWRGQSNGLKRRFTTSMRLGIARGEGVQELMQRIRGTRAKSFQDGVMAVSRREAATLVRSAVQTVGNEARLVTYERNADLIKGIQWVSTLDSRTSDICKALDGKTWTTIGRKPIGHIFPFPGSTAHWNCRSTQVPVLKSWKDLASKSVVKTEGRSAQFDAAFRRRMKEKGLTDNQINRAVAGARASMDGQVAQSLTFQEWLKSKERKDTGFAASLLGEEKAKLFRAGKITTSDLIDQNLNPVSIFELQAIAEGRRARRGLSLENQVRAEVSKLKDADFKRSRSATVNNYRKAFVNEKFNRAYAKDKEFFVDDKGEGPSAIPGRFQRFMEFLTTRKQKIELSDVTVDKNGNVSFINGRHRFAVLRSFWGEMPVAMSKTSFAWAVKHGYLKRTFKN